MASSNPSSENSIGTYELMGLRVQQIVNSYAAQKKQNAIVSKGANELDEDWSQLLSDLSETNGVKVVLTETGAVKITWQSLDD